MNNPKPSVQYGLWKSPITPAWMARGGRLTEVGWDTSGALVWLEGRSDRNALVVQPADGQAFRDLNSQYSARGGVGYGGGEFCVGQGQVYFAEAASGRIYRQPVESGLPVPVTPAFGHAAAPRLSPDGRWLLYVHTYEDQDSLVIVDSKGEFWPQKLVSGADFYMQPAWSTDGTRIAWISWNFPNMPWDGTYLQVGRLALSSNGLPILEDVQTVAGDLKTAIFQPEFSPDGRFLAYISDANGWNHLYVLDLVSGQTRQLTSGEMDDGTPAWVQGLRRYGFSPDGRSIYCLRSLLGFTSVWQIEVESGQAVRLEVGSEYTDFQQIAVRPALGQGDCLALIASGGATPKRLITYSASAGTRIVRRAFAEELPASLYSSPEPFEWRGMDGGQVYGLFFPPQNPAFEGRGRPPVIIHIHGGPTSQETAAFMSVSQFFTSRGYGYLAVNYRGSTGYGRAYQDMLLDNWGIYDVQDAVSGAKALAEAGRVDGERMVIMGGSAGGYTVFKALEDYPGFFKAGICLYGISNQFTASMETHKFELHYNDLLLGTLPEASALYRERSPIFFTDKIQDPIAIFQGEIDPVVLRNQSDEMVASLQRRGVPHIYHVYPGEGHGFRKAETIQHFYEAVEAFLKQYVIFS